MLWSVLQYPEELIPNDAQVEMNAKRAAGYYSPERIIDINELSKNQRTRLNE